MEAYPLTWPQGWKRTSHPIRSRFGKGIYHKPSIATGKDKILDEIRRLGGRDVIISTNLKLKLDGLPYSNQNEPNDRGVAVYFTKVINGNKESMCIACDSYDKIGCNLYAIGSSIEAMRAMERWGCSEMLNRAFTGFKALPEQATVTKSAWFVVLHCTENADRDFAYNCYRHLCKKYHPEGSVPDSDKFIEVTEAWEAAKKFKNWK